MIKCVGVLLIMTMLTSFDFVDVDSLIQMMIYCLILVTDGAAEYLIEVSNEGDAVGADFAFSAWSTPSLYDISLFL